VIPLTMARATSSCKASTSRGSYSPVSPCIHITLIACKCNHTNAKWRVRHICGMRALSCESGPEWAIPSVAVGATYGPGPSKLARRADLGCGFAAPRIAMHAVSCDRITSHDSEQLRTYGDRYLNNVVSRNL
jgi:hypothetical protein